MHSFRHLFFAACCLTLAACQTKGSKWNNPRDEATFHPANLTDGGTAALPEKRPAQKIADIGVPLDAMLGQVNGKPLYAGQILRPMEPQLARLGQDVSRKEFTERANTLVTGALINTLREAQMLSKAEAYLKDGQKAGLGAIVERHREELLRRYGEGSLALAESNFFRDQGITLEEELKDFREKQVIGYYMFEQVNPLINVTRRDIERYYADHQKDYNKPEVRKIRIIKATSPLAAMQIASALGNGKAFKDLAGDEQLNKFNPGQNGAFAAPIEGVPDAFSPEINAALATLKRTGAWAGPTLDSHNVPWFVEADEYTPGTRRSLDDAQLEIRNILDQAQRKRLSDQVYAKAAQEGSTSDIRQMAETLLMVTVSRYAKP